MSAREALMAAILGLRTQGLPEWRERAERMLDAYRDQVLQEAAAKIRAKADTSEVRQQRAAHVSIGMREAADLIDP